MGSSARGGAIETVETYALDSQSQSRMAGLPDGGWINVYQSTGIDGSSHGIAFQRYDFFGRKLGPEVVANTWAYAEQYTPVVTVLADGGWVIAWSSIYGDGEGGSSVNLQRYDNTGNPVGGEVVINTTTANYQSDVSITALTDGGWVASWTDNTKDGSNNGVYQQRFDADGVKVGAETAVNLYTTDSQTYSTTAALLDGGWVTSWTSTGQDGSIAGIYMRRYASDGSTSGDDILVNTSTTNNQASQSITALADGGWVIAWHSAHAEADYGIFMQRYQADGTPIGGQRQVNTTSTGFQLNAETAALSDGGWVVVWMSNASGLYVIYQQRYDASGAAVGGETAVSTVGSNSIFPTAVALADGSWTVSWTDSPGGADDSVKQRHFALDIVGTNAADNLTGTYWDETLFGYGGNDTLFGGSGDDILIGGGGNDTYVVNSSGDDIQEGAGQGYDTVKATVSYSIVNDSVEEMILIGSASINGIGNSADNAMTGNGGNNILSGSGGHDVIEGMAGDDDLRGGSGNDLLNGGAGNDIFDGGTGIDTVTYSDASAAVTVSLALATAQATGGSGSDTIANVENLVGSKFNDSLTGDSIANMIEGGAGNDLLDGGAGVDTLSYASASAGITVSLALAGAQATGGAGTDTVSNFESILGSRFNDTLTGSGSNNSIEGGLGDDVMDGGGGTDTASYASATAGVTVNLSLAGAQNTVGAGIDTLSQFEFIIGSAFADKLTGDDGSNRLDGGAGNDELIGGGGNDILVGNGGLDKMTGGAGRDYFQFAEGHCGAIAVTGDQILDFSQADTDRIDLHFIDSDDYVAGDQAFTFLGTGAFTFTPGELRYEVSGVTTLIQGDSDGDAVADFTIVLLGNYTLVSTDFVL